MDALVVQLAKKAKGGGGDDEASEGEDGGGDMDKVKDSAVSDLMSGLDEGDSDAVKAALEDFFRACAKAK